MRRIISIFLIVGLLFSSFCILIPTPITSHNLNSDQNNLYNQEILNEIEHSEIINNFNNINGFFTENYGQIDNESVRYYVQGKGIWFLNDGIIFDIQVPIDQAEIEPDPFERLKNKFESKPASHRKGVVLKLNFEGANKIIPEGGGVLFHKSNFFYGNDSTKWRNNVPNYQEILYENIYDNIDLKYYFSSKGLKYDFIVHPGGNPNDIKMSYEGAEHLIIESSGNLRIVTSIGDILDSDLFIYQDIDSYKNKVKGTFSVFNSITYGFDILSKYDYNKDLIIDPLIYSTFVGGHPGLANIAYDANGNAYVTGGCSNQSFPTTPGAYDTTLNDIWGDAIVFKLNSSGSQLLFSTFIGGTKGDGGSGIAIDPGGNVYVIGNTNSNDFPTTPGAYDTTSNDIWGDGVVFKLNSNGSSLLYSSYFGGTSSDSGIGIKLDSSSNVYVGGYTSSSDFPTTPGAFATTSKSIEEAFALKLNPAGNGQNDLIYSTYIGSSNIEYCYGFTIDSSGNAYLTGRTRLSNDFPTTLGAYDTTHNGNTNTDDDIFVTKLNPTGSALLYSTFIGGIDEEVGEGIAVDANGNIIVTGYATSTNFPTTQGAFDTTFNGGGYDSIVLKLNPSGNGLSDLVYSTFVGGSDIDMSFEIAVDSSGSAYVTGGTVSPDFPTTINAYDNVNDGGTDSNLFKLNSNGSSLLYSTFIGGSASENFVDIAIDSNKNVYLVGGSNSSNFPTTPGAYDTTYTNDGWADGVVLKFWINSTTPPNVLNLQISKPSILRTNPIYLYSNASDPDDAEEDLTPIFEYRDSNEQIWNNSYFSNLHYNNSRWEVCFISPENATTGQYDFRVRYYDSGMSFSNWYYLNDSLLVLNNFPEIIDLSLSIGSSIQNQNLSVHINTTDIEDEEQNLTIELKYKDPADQNWNTTYLGTAEYSVNRWGMDFCAPFGSLFGNYDFKVRAIDVDGNNSNWFYKNDSLLIYNLNPEVVNIEISQNVIYRTGSISLLVNGSDYETSEQLLEFYIQYKLNNEENWKNLQGNYLNEQWQATYITKINTTLGYYDFRAKFKDLNNGISEWLYLNNSLLVLNNLPIVENIELSKNGAILGDEILIQINGNDIEEPEVNLSIILEYRDPTEQSWDILYLDSSKYINDRWEHSFLIPFDAPFGHYDFRTKFIDSDGNHSAWLYANDSLLVSNMNPKVIDLKLSENIVYRTNSIFLSINGTDHETPESMLIFYAEFKHDIETVWTEITGDYSISNNNWDVEFVSGIDSILGYYDFRVKFVDNETASSGWVYFNDSVEILNNAPIISENIDEIYVDADPIQIDITQYGSDIEDNNEDLNWNLDETKSYDFIKSIKLIGSENNILEIVPKEDVVGQEDIELTLRDKDNDVDIKSDITIYVNSTIIVITNETPKVTLMSPSDESVLNTFTPKLEWNLEYSGEDIITYSIFLDENPNPFTLITSGISATSFTIEDELEPGKTYYWKVIPKNGLCISDPFSFTINSVIEPIYQVNLTAETNYIVIKQGDSSEIELTVENEGNIIDNYELKCNSNELQTLINIDKTSLKLDPGIISIQRLSITISENFEIGEYSIFITAISQNDESITDEDIINVEVVSKDFTSDYKVKISVSPDLIDIYQNESKEVTLTILNDGNIIDEYLIYFQSDDFSTEDIKLIQSSLLLKSEENNEIKVKITIPENKKEGEYKLEFIAKSEMASDNTLLTINVKQKQNQELLDEDLGNSRSNFSNVCLFIIMMIIAAIVISSIFIGGTEIGKYKFLTIFFVPLLSKLQREKKSDNFARGQILGYIKARPGEHYNAIKNALELNNGTLAYHVRILEKGELIYSKRDGLYTRFYPKGIKAPLSAEPELNDTQKNIVEKIQQQPGITQHEIVDSLKESQQVISYNLSNLTRSNIIKIEQDGREKKYFLNNENQPEVKNKV